MTICRLSQTKDRRGATVVNIDGQLVGEYVPVAENCCSQALYSLSGPPISRTAPDVLKRIPGFLNFTDQQIPQVLAMRSLIEPSISVGYLSNVTSDVFTVSALTSEGSSGSPVLDRQGKVIAILFASWTGVAGGSLAVPSSLARELVGTEQ